MVTLIKLHTHSLTHSQLLCAVFCCVFVLDESVAVARGAVHWPRVLL